MKSYSFLLKTGLVVLLCAGLNACALLKPAAPLPLIYDISAPNDLPKGSVTRSQFLVKEPDALKFLNNEHIVIRLNRDNIEYLPVAAWSDTLPKMLQARIIDTFENSGRANAVAKPGDGLVIDYQIVSDIRAFEIVVAPNSTYAHVEISVKLLNDANGLVVRSKIFSAKAGVAKKTNAGYVHSIDNAFDKVVKEILTWTLKR